MANIDTYLDIIANEPKGRLVKGAIYDALKAINEQAEIRPPAKREVPVGEMIGDTGYLTYWEIGDMTPGELGFSSDIQNGWRMSGTGVDYSEAESTTIYAGASGRIFAVAVNDWVEDAPDLTITDSSSTGLTWELMTSFEADMTVYDGGEGSSIKEEYPDDNIVVKGIVHSHSELPTNAADGDVYICPLDDTVSPPSTIFWRRSVEGVLAGWFIEHMSEFKREVSKRVTVWSAVVPNATGISVSVHTTNQDEGDVTLGVFYVADTKDVAVSELDYRVCLVDQNGFYGVKSYDLSKEYKGEVSGHGGLPFPGDSGDTYYDTTSDEFVIWNDADGWDYDPAMYLSYSDYVEEGQPTGVSEGTYRIFVVVSLLPFASFASALTLPSTLGNHAEKAACPTGEACTMTAWMQKPSASPVPFNYVYGRELYRWVYNGSVAIIPLEIGERSTQ